MTIKKQLLATLKSMFSGASQEVNAGVTDSAQGYRHIPVDPDGHCGYAATDPDGKKGRAAREAAHALLTEHLHVDQVRALLQPALFFALDEERTNYLLEEAEKKTFIDYLKKNSLQLFESQEAKKLFSDFLTSLEINKQNSTEDSANELRTNFEKLIRKPSVVKAFIDFDIMLNPVFVHPSVLQALAFIRGIELNIWTTDPTGELVPHMSGINYCPNTTVVSDRRQDIVYVNGEHFDQLRLDGYRYQVPKDGIKQVNYLLLKYLREFKRALEVYRKEITGFRKTTRLIDVERLLADITECQRALTAPVTNGAITQWSKSTLTTLKERINKIDSNICRERSMTTSRLHKCLANTGALTQAIISIPLTETNNNPVELKKLSLNRLLTALKTSLHAYQDDYRTSWTSWLVTSTRKSDTEDLLTKITAISSRLNNPGAMTLAALDNLVTTTLPDLHNQIQKIHDKINKERPNNSRLLKILLPYVINDTKLKQPMAAWSLHVAQSLASDIAAARPTEASYQVARKYSLQLASTQLSLEVSSNPNAIDQETATLATRIEQAQLLNHCIDAIETHVQKSENLVTTATLTKILAAIENVITVDQAAKQMLTLIIKQIARMAGKGGGTIESEASFSSLESGSTDKESKASDSTSSSSPTDAANFIEMPDSVQDQADDIGAIELLTFLATQFTALAATLPHALSADNSVQAVTLVIASVITNVTAFSSVASIKPPNGNHPGSQSFPKDSPYTTVDMSARPSQKTCC